MFSSRRRRAVVVSTAVLSSLVAASAAHAAPTIVTWVGGSGDFTLGTNWLGGTAPANDTTTNAVLFNSSGADPLLAADRSVAALYFNGGAHAINGAGTTLTLGQNPVANSGFTGDIYATGSAQVTINPNVSSAGTLNVLSRLGSNVNLAGNVSATTIIVNNYNTGSPYSNGMVTLSGTTAANLIDLEAGTLRLASSTALGAGGASKVRDLWVASINGGSNSKASTLEFSNNINLNSGTVIHIGTGAQTQRSIPSISNQSGNNTFTGTIDVQGGSDGTDINGAYKANIISSTAANGSLTLNGAISGAGTLNFDGPGLLAVNSNITFNGNVNKIGAGVLTLAGSNSVTGDINVRNGTLDVATAAALGNNRIGLGYNPGAANASTATTGTLRFSNSIPLTLNNAITVYSGFQFNTVGGGVIVNNGTADVTLNGALLVGGADPFGNLTRANLTFDGTGHTILAGQVTATQFSKVTKAGSGTLTITGNNANWPPDANAGGDLVVTGGRVELRNGNALGDTAGVYLGAGTTLDLGSTNETIGSLGDAVYGSPGGTVSLGSATLTLARYRNEFSGTITGTGGVTVDGGYQYLSGVNTFTGPVTFTNGTLVAGADVPRTGPGAFGNNASTTLVVGNASSNSLVQTGLSGDHTIAKDINFTAGPGSRGFLADNVSHASVTGDLTLGQDTTFTVYSADSTESSLGLTLSGNITGPGAIVLNGAGSLFLAGAAAPSASNRDITIINGTLALTQNTPAGATPIKLGTDASQTYGYPSVLAGGPITVARAVDVNFDFAVMGGYTNDSSTFTGDITLNKSLDVHSVTTAGKAVTFDSKLSGPGGIYKTGSGTVVLTNNANNFTGQTAITAGTLRISNEHQLGNAPTSYTEEAIFMSQYDGASVPAVLAFDGSMTLNANRGTKIGASSTATFEVSSGNTVSYNGVIAGFANTSRFLKSGGGTLALGGASSFTGGLTVRGGTLLVNAAVPASGTGAAANSPLGRQAVTLGDSSSTASDAPTLLMNGSYNFARALTVASGGSATPTFGNNTDASVTYSGTVSLGRTTNIYSAATSTGKALSVTGVMSGAGGINLTGPGTTVLSGTNTFTGKVSINSGTLQVSTINNVNASTGSNLGKQTTAANATINLGAATLKYTGAAASTNRPIALTASGGTIDASGTGALTLNATGNAIAGANTDLTLAGSGSGVVTTAVSLGTGSLTKSGAGTWTLNAANAYSGNTTVQQGTLKLGANGTLGSSSKVTVNAGATLDVSAKTGGVNINAVSVLTGQGNVVGNLNVDGKLTGSLTVSGSLTGSGSVNPGNSPGILTASSVNPSGGLDFSFEFTQAGSPNYANAAAASGNDVLRLTSSTPFASALGAANVIDFFLPTLTANSTFRGGFYTDAGVDFLPSLKDATIRYYTLDPNGDTTYNGQKYAAVDAAHWTLTLSTVADAALFDGVHTTSGYVTQISAMTAVPLPSAAAMGLAILPAAALYRRLRRRQ